ncbi:MAG: hypothetical protein SFY70_07990 [Bacteroidia bacterium]|nr:hypothetical protein [Bacteroidia bacterium]
MSVHLNPHFLGHVRTIGTLVETPPTAGAVLLGPVSGLGARLLQWAEASPQTTLYILMSGLPPQADLQRVNAANARLGVYMPNEKKLARNTLLGQPEVNNLDAIALLKKYAAVRQPVFVLADTTAIADAHHYAELVAPLADTLLLLGEHENPARARAIYDHWHRARRLG